MSEFRKELEATINRFSQENGSNTPDFILASFLTNCLMAFDSAVNARDRWYSEKPQPGLRPPTLDYDTSFQVPPPQEPASRNKAPIMSTIFEASYTDLKRAEAEIERLRAALEHIQSLDIRFTIDDAAEIARKALAESQ